MNLTITYVRNFNDTTWSATVAEIPDIVVEGLSKRECRNKIFKLLPYSIHLVEIEYVDGIDKKIENDNESDIKD